MNCLISPEQFSLPVLKEQLDEEGEEEKANSLNYVYSMIIETISSKLRRLC